jgi:hypothetical protein
MGAIAGSQSAFGFAGPQATVTTAAGQALVGSASLVLGTLADVAHFRYTLCYQPSSGGAISTFPPGLNWQEGAVSTLQTSFSTNAAVVPGAGAWKVGACVYNFGSHALDGNDVVSGWVQIVNAGSGITSAGSVVAAARP